MNLHIDGFEEFAGEQAPQTAMTRAGYTMGGQWSLVNGREAVGLSTATGSAARTLAWTDEKFSVGLAHSFSGRGSVLWLDLGDKRLVLWMNPDSGTPMLNEQAGGALPTVNRFYYFEIEIARSTGLATLHINNRYDMSYSLGSLGDVANVTASLGFLEPHSYRPEGMSDADTGNKFYDDFYMRDGERFGPITITTRFPTVDDVAQWFKANPTISHSESVSMHPPKPLDNYLAAATPGLKDAFRSSAPLVSANPVLATGIVVMARKSPTLDMKLGVFIGGADDVDAPLREDTRNVPAEWGTYYICFDQVDGDTPQGITEAQFGITVEAP